MPFDLENKIDSVYSNSLTTLKCVEQGPAELSVVAADVRHLAETLQLLSHATIPSVALFDMATREQASELWSALEACDRNMVNLRSIWTSFSQLDWTERSQFTTETCLDTSGSRYLQAKIVNFSSSLKALLVGFKVSSTTLNWPPVMDVLGQIQLELLAEGVQVDHLQARKDEIKAYIRSLAIGDITEPGSVDQGPPLDPPSPLNTIPEIKTSENYPPPSRQVIALADQFRALFQPKALRRPSTVGLITENPGQRISTEIISAPETHQPKLATMQTSARKDSMDFTATSLVTRLSSAMASMAFSVSLQNKSHSIRPPPQRSSSAVFRGLADEERVTGD